MFGGDRDLETICAISTPPGKGGIHVIRVSGSRSLQLTRSLAPFLPLNIESHRVYFGTLRDPIHHSESIDEVLVTYFKIGHSYTSEETIEISCHGSPFIANRIVKAFVFLGARVADRGEFTYRAFMGGNLDLVQAESVLSLIESESKKSSSVALSQLKGGLSSELKSLEKEILALLARLEVSIDFTGEDIEVISSRDLLGRIEEIQNHLRRFVQSFEIGIKIQNGFEVVFVGEPNVGKSSLLNRVLSEDRAIVSDIPGTTRDLIQETLLINGVKVTITDTAGIRETADAIEKIGVKKTKEAIERADIVVVVLDVSNRTIMNELDWLSGRNLERWLFVANKADLVTPEEIERYWKHFWYSHNPIALFKPAKDHIEFIRQQTLTLSALKEEAKSVLLDWISRHLNTGSFGDDAILSHSRHFENLKKANECIDRAYVLALESSSPEFLALEIKEILVRVQETLGERFDDQILDQVFREFCIGK